MIPDKKILVKGGPKEYKSGPGPTGAVRQLARLYKLQREATKAARKAGADPLQVAIADELTRAVLTLGRLHAATLERLPVRATLGEMVAAG
jgi:hypothetical protein